MSPGACLRDGVAVSGLFARSVATSFGLPFESEVADMARDDPVVVAVAVTGCSPSVARGAPATAVVAVFGSVVVTVTGGGNSRRPTVVEVVVDDVDAASVTTKVCGAYTVVSDATSSLMHTAEITTLVAGVDAGTVNVPSHSPLALTAIFVVTGGTVVAASCTKSGNGNAPGVHVLPLTRTTVPGGPELGDTTNDCAAPASGAATSTNATHVNVAQRMRRTRPDIV